MSENNELLNEIESSSKELREVLDGIIDCFFQGNFNEAIKMLENFYEKHERHLYSVISEYMIDKSNEEKIPFFAYGIRELINKVEDSEEKKNFKKKLFKLYDHIQLEYTRLISVTKKLEQQIRVSEITIERFENKMGELNIKAEKLDDKIRNMEKEYIAILGIFSAVVLAFVGEMAFSTSVLENMYQIEHVENVIAIITMIGIVFANILFLLFNFVSYLVKGVNLIPYRKVFKADCGIAIFIIILLLIAA